MAATEDQLNKHFAVQPGGQLVVDVDFGAIIVNTTNSNEVVVDVWRKVSRSSKAAEESFLRESPVAATQEGNTITVRWRSKEGNLGNWSGWSLFSWRRNQTEVKYTLSVPAQFNARLKTAGGSITVRDLSGEVKVETSGGSLDFARVHGPLAGNTSGGSIHAEDCQGALNLTTSGGSVEIKGGGGSLNGQTSGGSVSVKEFKGPASVHSSGGGLTMENISGAINASTSGGSIHAVLLSPLPGSVRLETAGGGVTVNVPENAAFNLDAGTSGGGVSNELPMTSVDKKERNELKGAINGGGQPVQLHTSGGGIHVKKI